MAKAGDACTAAKETLPMLSLKVKPKVFCAVLDARDSRRWPGDAQGGDDVHI
jgi:hypothetical protein